MAGVLHSYIIEVLSVLCLSSCRKALLGIILLTTLSATRAQLPAPTVLEELMSTAECSRCSGTLLRGRSFANPGAKWGMISDLPESFKG